MTDQKKWYQSKTVWFNILSFLLGIAGLASTAPLFTNKPEFLGILGTVTSIGNLLLRVFFTDTPIQKTLI